MAESVVAFLVNKLSLLLLQESKLLQGVEKDVQFIRDELSSMMACLKVADGMEESDPELEAWVKQVRHVAHDIEDILDEFTIRLARHHGRGGFYGFLYKICHQIKNMKLRHGIASKIKDIKARVIEVAERHLRYNKYTGAWEQGPSSSTLWYDPRGDALLLEEVDLVGIEGPKQDLIDLLLNEDSKLKVIPVVGMGGLGKTTLAKQVFDNKYVKNHFQNRAWITVSQSFKIEELLKNLIQQLLREVKQPSPVGLDNMSSIELKEQINQFLKQSRYIIVLDDIWSVDAWDAVKIALPKNNFGSRVLVTTRIWEVATSSAEYKSNLYEMKALSPKDSRTLFCKKVFRGNDCPPYLNDILQNILARCEGLPLAIVVIAGVLAVKQQSRSSWELVYKGLSDSTGKLRSMKKILLLGYNDLPYYLKSCFLYLSCFPEDYLISYKRIIRLWIAEGFVEERDRMTPQQVANTYLEELFNRSFIQAQAMKARSGLELNDMEQMKFRVHDLLREFILTKAKKQDFLVIAGEENMRWPKKVRRFSIQNALHYNALQNISQGQYFSKLRSLLACGVVNPEFESFLPLLFTNGGPRLLRVLDLRETCLKQLPNEVVNLLHLRYLSLRGTKVRILPNWIGQLQNLQTLDLINTSIIELPCHITKIKQLQHLLVYRKEKEEILEPFYWVHGFKPPSKIGDLQSLQTLEVIDASHANSNIIVTQIGRLTQLRELRLVNLRSKEGMALCSSIEKLRNLNTLDIESLEDDEMLNLQSLCPAPMLLKDLYLAGLLEKLPDWISSLCHLTYLSLRSSKLKDDPVPTLEHLPNLVELVLISAYEGEGLHYKPESFKKLQTLYLARLRGLRCVTIEKGAMPQLRQLTFQECQNLEDLPSGVEHLTNLQLLQLIDMPEHLISKINANAQGSDHQKIAHIPEVTAWDTTSGNWVEIFSL